MLTVLCKCKALTSYRNGLGCVRVIIFLCHLPNPFTWAVEPCEGTQDLENDPAIWVLLENHWLSVVVCRGREFPGLCFIDCAQLYLYPLI